MSFRIASAAAVIVCLTVFSGCGSTGSAASNDQAAVTGATKHAYKAQTVCPVMGGPSNKNIYTDYEGKRIYFCCSGCVEMFKKDPAKYMKQMKDQGITLEKSPSVSK